MKKNSLNVILDTVFSAKSINGEKSHSFISYKLVKAVENLSGYDLDLFLNRAINHPNFPSNMDFSLRTVFTIEQSNTIEFKNFISELVWYKHIFIRYKKHLNDILSAKARLEKLVLFATGSECIKYLDEIESSYGVSFWSIDARLLINKVLLNESNGLYVKSILSKTHYKLTEFMLQQLLFKHQVHNFDDFSKNLIKILDDMRTTQDNGYARNLADGISSFLIPLEFDKNIDLKNRTLAPFTNLPLIDQFIIFQRTISDLQLHGNGLRNSELSLIAEINSFIKNNYLNNILDGRERNIENIDEHYKSVIRRYTIGDYTGCISEINSVRTQKTILPLIEIYAKSHVYLDKKISDSCIFNKLTNWLIAIIKCDRRAGKYIDEFELLASKIYFNSNSSSLFFTLYNLISDNHNKLNISRINLTKNGSFVTSLHLNITIKELWTELGIKENEIPKYRLFKFKDLANLSFDEIKKHYEVYNDNVIIRSEYLKDYTNFLLENEKYELCIQFIAENCIGNPANYYYFPIRKIIDFVKDNIFDYASVALSILIDIFVKSTSNTSNELLLESYESLVDISNINRPSTHYCSKQLTPLEHYFLKFICIPSVMDSDPSFTGTDDLKKERIAIIDLLLKEHDDADLLKEKDEIIDEISFEEIKTKYETGKIFVDIENLKRAKLERYRYYFDALKDSLILGLEPPEDFALITDDGNITAIPSGDTNSIIHELLKELISDFVKNENYGLDKYLSADIRHGVFENQLRSSAEKSQLITDMDGTGQYSKSNLIIETYPLINPIINNEIGTAIADFSYHFDIELAKANSWFNVKTMLISESQQGMIDFLISVDMFNSFKAAVSNQASFEKFFDACINFMWERTFRCLNDIKERVMLPTY